MSNEYMVIILQNRHYSIHRKVIHSMMNKEGYTRQFVKLGKETDI